jgi:hypothetical protein
MNAELSRAAEPHLIEIKELSLTRNGINFFSFCANTPNDIHSTNWMTVVDGVLHDAYWVEDDTYDDEDNIPTSPVVSIPAPASSVDDHLRPLLLPLLLEAIREKTGLDIDVPMLCEARDAEEIETLKNEVGYKWDASTQEYIKNSSRKTMGNYPAP